MNSAWLECLCLVKFDIEIGQIVEWSQPLNSMTQQEEKNISMLAFPDSNSFAQNEGNTKIYEGYLKYIVRLKRAEKNTYSFGFCLFFQKKDEDNPRGYTQKSIVILTNLPLINFFYQLLENIYQNCKEGILKAQLQNAYEQINSWEKPSPNKLFNLQLFNSKITVEVPHYLKMQRYNTQAKIQIQEVIEDLSLTNLIQIDDLRDIGQFQETNIFASLPHAMLVYLPKLWELILTNQQFMVIADSPQICSEIILGMISLISPIKYSGDYRPYFTIYDKEFQQITQELDNSIMRNIIIGVTNPYFLKAFQKFPVIIRCDSQGVNSKLLLQTNKEFCLSEDKSILKMMMPIKNEETKAINNSLIKKFYRNMSLEFMGIFEMYFASQQNQIKKFDEKEFIEFLKTRKVSYQELFDNKQKFYKLYQNFIRSSNFVTYLNDRKNVYIAKSIL